MCVCVSRYERRWQDIDAACEEERRQLKALEQAVAAEEGQEFFSQLWRKYNLQV